MSDHLYHFTAARLIHSILEEGITKGGLTTSINPPRVKKGYRWLTKNPDFDQSWNVQEEVDYDRAAYRIAIDIPRLHRDKLLKWTRHCEGLVGEDMARVLNSRGDPEEWVLFKGNVRPRWFVYVDAKEGFPEISLPETAK